MNPTDEMILKPAPELRVERWFNTPQPFNLQMLRGQVVALHTFQMLCPGCVSHGLPLARRMAESFSESELRVIGLHTVFEHHAAMSPASLEVFLHEYRITFPVGVDLASERSPVPQTMARYGLRGTPSLLLIDRQGRLRHHKFGPADDLITGAQIGALLAET